MSLTLILSELLDPDFERKLEKLNSLRTKDTLRTNMHLVSGSIDIRTSIFKFTALKIHFESILFGCLSVYFDQLDA